MAAGILSSICCPASHCAAPECSKALSASAEGVRGAVPSIQRRIEAAPPSNCPKMPGVAFTGVELVIWTIEGSGLMWKITHAAKGNVQTSGGGKKRQKLQLLSEQGERKKICDLGGDLLRAVVSSASVCAA